LIPWIVRVTTMEAKRRVTGALTLLAGLKGGAVQVFIELRDANYPGSTYTLADDAKTDRLVGRYHQAVARETFEVFFVRLKT